MFKSRIKTKIIKEKLKNRKKNKKLEKAVFDPNFVRIGAQYKKLSCNFHLASFYFVNSFFRQSEREFSLIKFEF